jgi:hypothetical protein
MADLTVVKALEPQINAEHMKAMEGAKSYMEHAMKAGDLLANAKKILPHGAFQNWITDNLAFTVRTAQNYMRAAAHRKEHASANVEQISDAYSTLTEPKPIRDVPEVEAEDDEVEVLTATVQTKDEADDSIYWYWREINLTIAKLDSAYGRLARHRNKSTPKSVAYMVGNLKLMANSLRTWNPEDLMACPECKGTGKVDSGRKNKNGKAITVNCDYCLGGKCGYAKETEA